MPLTISVKSGWAISGMGRGYSNSHVKGGLPADLPEPLQFGLSRCVGLCPCCLWKGRSTELCLMGLAVDTIIEAAKIKAFKGDFLRKLGEDIVRTDTGWTCECERAAVGRGLCTI
jgi:hypothetical protein